MKLYVKEEQLEILDKTYFIANNENLLAILFGDCVLDDYIKRLDRFYKFEEITNEGNKITDKAKEEVQLYCKGKLKEFTVPYLITGTPFQKLVQAELTKIPYGTVINYKQLAERVNSKAYRAVGSANGANFIPIIIPCHRVIASNNKLGGFACGLDYKIKLLQIEKYEIK